MSTVIRMVRSLQKAFISGRASLTALPVQVKSTLLMAGASVRWMMVCGSLTSPLGLRSTVVSPSAGQATT